MKQEFTQKQTQNEKQASANACETHETRAKQVTSSTERAALLFH